jgi:thiol-disulfide isomerase/thioredoxin
MAAAGGGGRRRARPPPAAALAPAAMLLLAVAFLQRAGPASAARGDAFNAESDYDDAIKRAQTDFKQSDLLTELSVLNWDQHVGNGSTWFVMLYAPWCGFCKATKPKLVDIADHYAGNSSVNIGMADATTQISLAMRFGVTSFPKFILVSGWHGSEVRATSRSRH